MGDDEIEDAVASGVTIFSKEVFYIISPLIYVIHDSLISITTSNQFSECEAAKLALRDLEDRHQELLTLEKNIQEVRDLFVELNHLVDCQVAVYFYPFQFLAISTYSPFRAKRSTV